MLSKHFKYLSYVLRHKWYVLIECCRLGIPWRGLVHDISKFLPSEWYPYVEKFYGKNPSSTSVKCKFDKAWLRHQHCNPHHWQYWLLQCDSPRSEFTLQEHGQGYEIFLSRNNRHLAMFDESILFSEDKIVPNVCNSNAYIYAKEIRDRLNKSPRVLPMPDKYRREMLADWFGAGKAQGKPDTKAWYMANKDNMILHNETREWIHEQLSI